MRDSRGFAQALLGDGTPAIKLTAVMLVFSGAFALYLSAVHQFLPHDIAWLGMSAAEVCALHGCRVAAFMFHDRASFGGALVAIGVLWLWIAEFPLRQKQAWAWWALAASGTLGFLSFLAYLGYGYLDSWHGVGTSVLLACWVVGMARVFPTLEGPRGPATLLKPGQPAARRSRYGAGRALMLATAAGMLAGGGSILVLGMTTVFVPQDLHFMHVSRDALAAISPRLIPLIAHDRAGFGGALVSCAVAVAACAWCGAPGRALWQALAAAGVFGFGCATGVHFAVGYVDATHLAPAVTGSV
ncbi:MAG TPA: hypothetical protein VGB15_18820, partial [Longimicrobium sp.]